MRILAISDVARWRGYKKLVQKHEPQVVVLAGDLISDGHAAFWRDAFEAIPDYRAERQEALRDVISGGSLKDVITIEHTLKRRYRDTPEFREARRKLHTNRFYSFLRFAGQRATVLVVKGDHDDDFLGDYRPTRINRIDGCQEISGKVARVQGVTFLGLGFAEAGFRIPLRKFVRQYVGSVDVVIAHAPHRNVQIVAELKPRLLVRGHFGGGRYLVNKVPSVFTSGGHALIEMPESGLPTIRALSRWPESLLIKKYEWIAPYPTTVGPVK